MGRHRARCKTAADAYYSSDGIDRPLAPTPGPHNHDQQVDDMDEIELMSSVSKDAVAQGIACIQDCFGGAAAGSAG